DDHDRHRDRMDQRQVAVDVHADRRPRARGGRRDVDDADVRGRGSGEHEGRRGDEHERAHDPDTPLGDARVPADPATVTPMEPYGQLRDYEPVEPRGPSLRDWLRRLWAPLAAIAGLLVKFGAVGLKFASLFVAIGGYALLWGWRFAVGFVALIFVHEMGHFFEARRQGLHASWPTFIPFIGAYVTIHGQRLNPWTNAQVALAGPLVGGVGATIFWAIGEQSGSSLLQALGYAGFLINLINLLPVGFLDGGVV